MKVMVSSAKSYDRLFLDRANPEGKHALVYQAARLSPETARLASGMDAVCCFVNDDLSGRTIDELARLGVRLIALRNAGYDRVDLRAAAAAGIAVCRVPTYSPEAVAEHAMALILALDRKIHRAHSRIREGNFSLEGLLGFNIHGRTVGIVGTGGIGSAMARILLGFGCRVIAQDPAPNRDLEAAGVGYGSREELFRDADIVTLHCPLNDGTRHLVNAELLGRSKRGLMLVNTGRGGLVDTGAAIAALKSGQLGSFALDVYEGEEGLFFEDRSSEVLKDDVFARLLTFPNVLITGHQAFFTEEAMTAIAATTMDNLDAFERTGRPRFPVG
ncbi:MAG: 2-hydroxyacid dehydrogenase [Bauldia sp.]